MTNLHYLDPHKSGEPAVLLLHGLGANSDSWILQVPALVKAGFRPIAPDAPGFSQSPYDGKGWSITGVAREMAELLKALKVTAAHVVGISMGGVIAQQFALDYPQQTRKLVLVNTFAVLRPSSISGWLYMAWRFILVHTIGLPTQARIVAHRIFQLAEQEELRRMLVNTITQSDPRAYRAAMRALASFNSTGRLSELKMPTLVITAENDNTVPPIRQQVLVESIPKARHVVIANAGHAVTVDSHEIFNQTLLTFLRE